MGLRHAFKQLTLEELRLALVLDFIKLHGTRKFIRQAGRQGHTYR